MTEKPRIREDVKSQYAEAEKRVLDRIEKFSDGLDERMDLCDRILKNDLSQKIEQISLESRDIGNVAVLLDVAMRLHLRQEKMIELELSSLAHNIIGSINYGNHLSFALRSRALIDHLVSIADLSATTHHHLERLWGITRYQSIKEILECLIDTFVKPFRPSFIEALGLEGRIHLNDLRNKYLKPRIPQVVHWYSYLSDFLPPNIDNIRLLDCFDFGNDSPNPPKEISQTIFEQILGINAVIIEHLDRSIESFATTRKPIEGHVERVLLPETTLATLFVKPIFQYTGDGRTRETAISFTGNLTHMQSIEMQYRYMRYHRLVSTMQSMEEADQGFMYDIQATQNGDLWFKVPDPDLLHPWK